MEFLSSSINHQIVSSWGSRTKMKLWNKGREKFSIPSIEIHLRVELIDTDDDRWNFAPNGISMRKVRRLQAERRGRLYFGECTKQLDPIEHKAITMIRGRRRGDDVPGKVVIESPARNYTASLISRPCCSYLLNKKPFGIQD